MLCARYPHKAWAAQYHPNQFRDHVDWLLGEEVAELRAAASEGRDSSKPSWQTILRYELEVRKEAMRRIHMCGLNVKEALWQARNSDDLRTRFLVTPLALGRRQQEEDRPTEQEPAAQEAAKAARTENTAKSSSEKESSGKERRQQADDEGQDSARRLEVRTNTARRQKETCT